MAVLTATARRARSAAARTSGEWVFYEGFAPGYGSPYYFRGTANFCASCHAPGLDYVLTKPSALP